MLREFFTQCIIKRISNELTAIAYTNAYDPEFGTAGIAPRESAACVGFQRTMSSSSSSSCTTGESDTVRCGKIGLYGLVRGMCRGGVLG